MQREIVGYAGLIQNARRSARTISGSLGFWRNDRDDTPELAREPDPWIGELRFEARFGMGLAGFCVSLRTSPRIDRALPVEALCQRPS